MRHIDSQHDRLRKVAAEPLDHGRLAAAKAAYTTRRVDMRVAGTLLTGELEPHSGDLVLACIEKLGQHRHIELGNGRRSVLYRADEIVVCYGNRYAPDQFEAVVPSDLGPCQLAAGGGIAARVLSRHSSRRQATAITPIGLIGDRDGEPLNLTRWALAPTETTGARPYTVAAIGTSMNSGKTTLAASLAHGLTKAGLSVGSAKVTGTGAGGDVWAMLDAGAKEALDFTDAGHATTYKLPLADVERIFLTLTTALAARGLDIIVIEVADGLLQDETAALISSPVFAKSVDGVIFAAADAMGAVAGADWLRSRGLNVLGIGGLLTASPLARGEANRATGIQVLSNELLSSGVWRPDRHFPYVSTFEGENQSSATVTRIKRSGPPHAEERPAALSA